ncbi:MAG: hypothetical protein ABI867_00975 [Kofleriaceae bacterium]
MASDERIAATASPADAGRAAAPEAVRSLIETRIAEDPDDGEAWMVYGDLLQKLGDPRGELMALQTAAEAQRAANPKARGGAVLAVTKHFARHAPALLGPLAQFVTSSELDQPPFRWKHGFIHRAELDDKILPILETLVGHPSGRLLVELAIQAASQDPMLAILERAAPRSLRELDLVVKAPLEVPAELWPRLPGLRRLALTAQQLELRGLALPELQRARFLALAMSPRCVRAIATAPWPKLERLELRIGSRLGVIAAAFEDLQPVFQRRDLPQLTHLKIRGAAFAGAIARAVAESPLVAQLHVLDLSHGTLTPQDVKVLGLAKSRFTNLRELWVPAGAMWGDGAQQLAGIAKHVISDARAPLDTLERDLGAEATAPDRYEEDME